MHFTKIPKSIPKKFLLFEVQEDFIIYIFEVSLNLLLSIFFTLNFTMIDLHVQVLSTDDFTVHMSSVCEGLIV